MATIDSTPNETDITNAYLGNCGYEEDASVAKARAFKTVLVAMRLRGITMIEEDGDRMEFSLKELADMERRANHFIAANAGVAAGGTGVTHVSLRNMRG